jgi:hypothetical protein
MKTTYTAYYWITGLTCMIPGILLLALSNRAGGDWLFFSLLFLSAIGFMAGVFVVNWKKGRETCDL